MPFFGWRLNPYGPATCWKAEHRPFNTTPLTSGEFDPPHTQIRTITDEELNSPLSVLAARYPYVPPLEKA
jgi:hypothetical protein